MFGHSPFKLHGGSYEGSDFNSSYSFNENRESAERASTLADELGTRWVDSLIGTNPTIAEISKAQIALLWSLPLTEALTLTHVSPLEDASQDVRSAQANATENTNALLKEMQDLVDFSLRRETNQMFSVAFCGTAKAG